MAQNQYKEVSQTVSPLLGVNTISAPTLLKPGQWRYLLNAYQTKPGNVAKRPGSVPVTAPLGATIERLMVYRNGESEKVLATSGTILYKYSSGTLTALTGALNSANVYDVDFTDGSSVSRKIIADGAALKAYNDTTETVAGITPAADDPAPAPPNALAMVNAKGIKYCFAYSGHVFVSDGSDTWWYLKRYTNDYLPSVQYERWVRENDYVNGVGIAFDNVCLMPLRRGWGVLMGTSFDDFQGNLFLNTSNGVIAPRSIARVTYPTGVQTIVYLSDDEVYEIYDTGYADTGSRRYSTRCISAKPDGGISFTKLGLTVAEKKAAVGYFDAKLNLYMLRVNLGSERLVYAYDTRNGEWYPWNNIRANDFTRIGETLYYAGETKDIHKFDETLYDDWDDVGKTVGTPIDWDVITDMISLDDTGYHSYLDYFVPFFKQYNVKSSVDISVRSISATILQEKAIKNEIMVWGVSGWGEAIWYNVEFTDLVGTPKRLPYKKKTPYFQVRFRNNRSEPVELYQYKLVGRTTGR